MDEENSRKMKDTYLILQKFLQGGVKIKQCLAFKFRKSGDFVLCKGERIFGS